MRKINHISEFENGRQYQRVADGQKSIVTINIKHGNTFAKDKHNDWQVHIGARATYYRLDVLSSSEEL